MNIRAIIESYGGQRLRCHAVSSDSDSSNTRCFASWLSPKGLVRSRVVAVLIDEAAAFSDSGIGGEAVMPAREAVSSPFSHSQGVEVLRQAVDGTASGGF